MCCHYQLGVVNRLISRKHGLLHKCILLNVGIIFIKFWCNTVLKSVMSSWCLTSGGRLNIKMPSYQYRDSHVKDKTVSPTVLSLTWESPYLGKTVFILRRGPGYLNSLADNYRKHMWMSTPGAPFIYHGLTIIPTWISNYIHHKGWDELTHSKLQRLHRWSLGTEKQFHSKLYWACDYLFMLGFQLNHVNKCNIRIFGNHCRNSRPCSPFAKIRTITMFWRKVDVLLMLNTFHQLWVIRSALKRNTYIHT